MLHKTFGKLRENSPVCRGFILIIIVAEGSWNPFAEDPRLTLTPRDPDALAFQAEQPLVRLAI